MKQQDVPRIVNPHRVILYLCALFAGCFGLYVIFHVTPALKAQILKDIEKLYQDGELIRAMERCDSYVADYPGDAMGHVWRGRCFDGIAARAKQEIALGEQYRRKADSPYFSEQRRNEFLRAAEAREDSARMWQKTDCEKEALAAYAKALDISPEWRVGIEVAKSHIHAGRFEAASGILIRISPARPEERLYHGLLDIELSSKTGRAWAEPDVFRAECKKTIDLYESIEPRRMPDMLKANKAVPHLLLANLSRRQGKWEDAEKFYREASRLSPDRYDFHMEWADTLQRLGDHVEAEDVLRRLSAEYPSWADAHYETSESQLAQGNVDAALLSLESSLYHDSDREDLRLYRKSLADESWKKHRSNPLLQKILGWPDAAAPAAPEETLRDLRMAIHSLCAKKIDEAACLLAPIAERYPDHYAARMGLLHCCVMQKGHRMAWLKYFEERQAKLEEEGVSEEEKVQLREKTAKEAEELKRRQNLGEFDLEACEKSIHQLSSELRRICPSVFTDLHIAHAYFAASQAAGEGDPAFHTQVVDALKAINDRIEDPAEQAVWRDIQAFSHFALRQFDEALAECERACQLDPASPAYPYSWGRTLLACDRKEAAAEKFRLSAANAGQMPYWRYRLGIQFLEIGEASSACEQFEVCTEKAPRRSAMWHLLAKAHLRGGETEQAFGVLERGFRSGANTQKLISYLYRDDDWKALRDDPRLVRLVRTYATR